MPVYGLGWMTTCRGGHGRYPEAEATIRFRRMEGVRAGCGRVRHVAPYTARIPLLDTERDEQRHRSRNHDDRFSSHAQPCEWQTRKLIAAGQARRGRSCSTARRIYETRRSSSAAGRRISSNTRGGNPSGIGALSRLGARPQQEHRTAGLARRLPGCGTARATSLRMPPSRPPQPAGRPARSRPTAGGAAPSAS